MNRKNVFSLMLFFVFMVYSIPVFAATPSSPLLKLKGEVLEVEELKEQLGSAIYTIKDLSSGESLKLLADKNKSLIKIGDQVKSAGDVLGGSKVTVIYQKAENQKLPEIVFAKVTNSYSS